MRHPRIIRIHLHSADSLEGIESRNRKARRYLADKWERHNRQSRRMFFILVAVLLAVLFLTWLTA